MKKKITLNPVIAILLILAIVIVSCFSTYCMIHAHIRYRVFKEFESNFGSMAQCFAVRWGNDNSHMLTVELSGYVDNCLRLLPFTYYGDWRELNDILYSIYCHNKDNTLSEIIDDDTARDLMNLSIVLSNKKNFDFEHNRDLMMKVHDELKDNA